MTTLTLSPRYVATSGLYPGFYPGAGAYPGGGVLDLEPEDVVAASNLFPPFYPGAGAYPGGDNLTPVVPTSLTLGAP